MPKEYINSRDHGRSVPVVTDGSGEDEKVTLKKLDDDSIVLVWDKTHGENVGLTIVDRATDPDGFEATKWINLNRSGCNRLIRFLRQARNDSFGKDE